MPAWAQKGLFFCRRGFVVCPPLEAREVRSSLWDVGGNAVEDLRIGNSIRSGGRVARSAVGRPERFVDYEGRHRHRNRIVNYPKNAREISLQDCRLGVRSRCVSRDRSA